MKSYKALRAQIAKLEQQAEAMRQTQVKAVVAQLKKTIAEYGLTAEELGLVPGGRGGRRAAKPAATRRAGSGVAKYRDPKTGQTWTGRGRPPAWIAGAKDRDAFLITAAPATESAAESVAPAAPRRAKAAKAAKTAKGPKRAAPRKAAAKKARRTRAANKTPAVQIEGGVAME